MAIPYESVTTSPHSPSHLRVVIDRLRRTLTAVGGVAEPGSTLDGTATGAVALGEVVYADGAGTFDLAQANAAATTQGIGVVTVAAGIGGTATIQTEGTVTCATWSLTPGIIYYLSPTVAGAITATAPTTVTQFVLPIGVAVSATQLKLLLTPLVLL